MFSPSTGHSPIQSALITLPVNFPKLALLSFQLVASHLYARKFQICIFRRFKGDWCNEFERLLMSIASDLIVIDLALS